MRARFVDTKAGVRESYPGDTCIVNVRLRRGEARFALRNGKQPGRRHDRSAADERQEPVQSPRRLGPARRLYTSAIEPG